MSHLRKIGLPCAALALLAGGAAFAQSAKTARKPPAPATSMVDPDALAAMDRVNVALHALSAFALTADVSTEDVLDNGQKLQFGGQLAIQAHRPDGLRIVVASGTEQREYYYDGKSLTIFAPTLGFYTSVPAPPTIALMLDKAKTDYGVELPLADLFAWDSDKTLRARILSGYVVGPEHLGDRTCDHYAFRQARVDWQIWIEQGARALPCKMVITNRTDPSMPQYIAVLHWNTDANPSAADLAFKPPAGAHSIPIEKLSGTASKGGK